MSFSHFVPPISRRRMFFEDQLDEALSREGSPRLSTSNTVGGADLVAAGAANDETFPFPSHAAPGHLLKSLIQATENERCAPDILPYPEAIVDSVVAQIVAQNEQIRLLGTDERQKAAGSDSGVSLLPFKPSDIMALEVQRAQFFLCELLRCRLRKIEALALTINYESQSGAEAHTQLREHLSHNEIVVADRLAELISKCVRQAGLQSAPSELQQLVPNAPYAEGNEVLPIPDIDHYVFCVVLDDLGVVRLGDDAEQTVHAGEVFIVPYRTFRPYILEGRVRMSTKEEVAAMMANSDAETKISLLKKAVVTVTKQKQVLEQQNEQLRQQMTSIGEELARVQEENKNLQRKLKTVELEAERKLKQAVATSKTSWKGLSSLVSGADGTDGLLNAKKVSSTSAASTGINLSPEDQEKIVLENENVHKQLFELQSNYETHKREWETQCSQQKAELQVLQAEIMELRSLADAMKQAHEQLNVDYVTQKALVNFCHHFFTLSRQPVQCRNRQSGTSLTVVPSLRKEYQTTLPHEVSGNLARGTVRAVISSFKTLMEAISVLVTSLRDSFGSHLASTTSGNIRCYKDRLITLLGVHIEQKTSLLGHAEKLEVALANPTPSDETMTEVLITQNQILSSVERWLTLLLEHARLLVDACFMMGGGNQNGNANAGKPTLVETMTHSIMEALAAVRGVVNSVRFICSDSHTVMSQESYDSVEWMIALERFWWQGCGASDHLQGAMGKLAELLRELTSSILPSPLRTVLQHIAEFTESFAKRVQNCNTTSAYVSDNHTHKGMGLPNMSYAQPREEIQQNIVTATPTILDENEVLQALYSTDLSAICYHTQMNCVLLELANKCSIIESSQKKIHRLEAIQQQQHDETERMRNAFQSQIRLLSEKLVEYTNNEKPL